MAFELDLTSTPDTTAADHDIAICVTGVGSEGHGGGLAVTSTTPGPHGCLCTAQDNTANTSTVTCACIDDQRSTLGLADDHGVVIGAALHLDPVVPVAQTQVDPRRLAALRQIAPVLLLKSRNETWEENLQSAAIIGKVVGQDEEMQRRLTQHRQKMAAFSRQLPAGASVLFGTSREQQFNLHSSQTYTGSVLAALGLKVPLPNGGAPMAAINLEQLLALNPQWLLVAHYRAESIVKKWQQDALWPMLQAEQKQQVAAVDSDSWARMRGIVAAERIASDMVKIVHHQAVDIAP